MHLKRPLPHDRSYDQIMNHFLVERSIANRLKTSKRESRKRIYATMYEELFSKVPDHPRLTRRHSTPLSTNANKNKLSLVSRFIDKSDVFVEFGPGDCRFAIEVAKSVKFSYGIDISDQHNPKDDVPFNFKLIVYDGYILDTIENNSVDIVFSDQLIEHFHPDDTKLHFKLVHRILKKGGKYIFRTPHSLSGPHDVSKYFCDEPECFHLKEWTYSEITKMIKDLKYSKFYARWNKRGINLKVPYTYITLSELIISLIPRRHSLARTVTKLFLPSLCGVAIK